MRRASLMFKEIKLAALSAADSTGISKLAMTTKWRNQKLLILCYHGISLEDEHRWNPTLYMSSESLRRRFEHLRRTGCHVLPFAEAVRALYAEKLPPRAVAITFDDGFFDFYQCALPLAAEFNYPLTMYLTTYYSVNNWPVFDLSLYYLLWKARGRRLLLPELGPPVELNDESLSTVGARLYQHAAQSDYSGREKNEFLERLAAALAIDFQAFCEKRTLHLMTPGEVAQVCAAGTDIQLHTHRHRVTNDQQHFKREISDNRKCIESAAGTPTQHFCYPSGFFLPEYAYWLKDMGIDTATTCVPGLATSATSPYLLPRIVDTSAVTEVEFSGWVSGLASLLPQRRFEMDQRSYLEKNLGVSAALHPFK